MKIKDIAALKTMVGHEFEPTEWFEVTQEIINDFAKATNDYQWIHVDVDRAKTESPFKKTIAHGLYSLSLFPKFIEDSMTVESIKMGVNYGIDNVRFPHPVPVGSEMRAQVTLDKAEDYKENGLKATYKIVCELKDVERPACVGYMTAISFE